MKDHFGPEYVVHVYDPKIHMEGFLVIHNTALGLGKGGLRMTPTVTADEVYRLAYTMTWKNAIAGIPFGGAKSGIVWKGGSDEEKEAMVRSFARRVRPFIPKYYIAGPDVSTGEKEMQWIAEELGLWKASTGKPASYTEERGGKKRAGLPHELGSTGFGVAESTAVTAKLMKLPLAGALVAIHGFGNVATFAYKFLTAMGAKVVSMVNRSATIYDPNGLDQTIIERLIATNGSLADYPAEKRINPDDFWGLPVDIMIPASVTDVIHEKNMHLIKAKMLVEGANIPMTDRIEDELHKRGVVIVPDFVANAGGVISSYAEYRGYSKEKMFELVSRKIRKSTKLVMGASLKTKENPRQLGMQIAKQIVEAAQRKI